MTTDELLDRLRKAASAFQESSAEDDNLAELAGELTDAFQELDSALVNGDAFPTAWDKPYRNR
jgi:hypothetical protein